MRLKFINSSRIKLHIQKNFILIVVYKKVIISKASTILCVAEREDTLTTILIHYLGSYKKHFHYIHDTSDRHITEDETILAEILQREHPEKYTLQYDENGSQYKLHVIKDRSNIIKKVFRLRTSSLA